MSSKELPGLLDALMIELELLGEDFPTEKIKENWLGDMKHFSDTFDKLNIKGITEQQILYEVAPDIWLQGYIDLIGQHNDEYFILDWKTSGDFKGKRIREMGRQLLLYKDAVEQTTNVPIDKVYWYMIKYLEIKHKNKTSILSRRNWVSKLKTRLKRAFKEYGEDKDIADMLISMAIQENSLDLLPPEIKNQFEVKPYIKEYKHDERDIIEARQYVVETVNLIKNEKDWQPNNTKSNSFFCHNLCNHRKRCEHI